MALDLSATATKLLRKLASKKESGFVQLKRETGGVIDPITGQSTDGVIEFIGLNAAVTSMPQSLVNDRINIDDKLVVCDNETIPSSDDKLVIGGVEHSIILINGEGGHAGVTQAISMAARK